MKRRVVIILFVVSIIFISFALIYTGIHFDKISKPNYIFSTGIDMIKDQGKNIFELNSKYDLGDTFTIEGTFKSTTKSEYVTNQSKTDPEYVKKLNVINNFNDLDTKFLLAQNAKEGSSLIDITSKTKNKDILTTKYYINNSTEYLLVNGIVKNYVNEGSSNYFEMLDEENTTKTNIDYLYDYMFESLKNNLKEEYFEVYKTETNIGLTTQEVNKITIELNDKRIKEILNGILKDLKSDEKAYKILSSVDEDFKKTKLNTKKKYLKNKETITISIYTSILFNNPVKYEVVHLNGDDKYTYSYVGNKDKGSFYYIEKNEVKYSADATFSNKKITLDIKNAVGKKVGSLVYQKDENTTSVICNVELEKMKYDINYSSKYKDVKKDSYSNEKNLQIKITDNLVSKIEGDYTLEYTVTNKANIEEDISTAVLKSTLTEEENNKLDNLYDIVKTRLESK